ncbi:hypothetical protein [Amycolatopsis sp. CA-230715]|uniref:hypothetical protein n=1 Tax=Amycolatopsis sp. CA-230715 TaxID=2745196 RepID=UPI001C039466|nr:hypothetical protein [Amycolatopsis sp. CA-230715]QWF78068.1 hypothetical protein HUW46_01463 [Amycolatopsis sp. CA-230715]
MRSGTGAAGESTGETSDNAFSTALRAAISLSGLSLDRIQARLQNRGVSVSVTALSYWQSGKRQPERASSISAVRVLEEILDLPAGALLGLLPPPRPRGASSRRQRQDAAGTMNFPAGVLRPMLDHVGAPHALDQHHQLRLVGLHDRCEIAPDGGQRATTARAVLQAEADGQNRWLLVYDHGGAHAEPPKLTTLRNCRAGRVAVDVQHGLTVAELLFDHPIDRGETQLIEYALLNPGPPYPDGRRTYYREFRRPVREYLLEVCFDTDTVPEHCWQYSRTAANRPEERKDLKMDTGGSVHAVALDFGPGVFGIAWS